MSNEFNHPEITDYAMPLMRIEKFTKEIHDLCLCKEFLQAGEIALNLLTETRILSATLALMDYENKKEKTQ